jgi:hypothetical protein
MSKLWLAITSVAVVLSTVLTIGLTSIVVGETALAGQIKCLFAETDANQGLIQAAANGSFSDSLVWQVYASTYACPGSVNVVIEIQLTENIDPETTTANPASYNLCATGGGSSDYVQRGYREVGVSGQLVCIKADGDLDVKVKANESGGLEIPASSMADVCVNSYTDDQNQCSPATYPRCNP